MLAMFSGVEVFAVLFVGGLVVATVAACGGFAIYAITRKAAHDGARDAARNPGQQPK
jgi:hypothetical protein